MKTLEQKVMARVHRIHILRRICGATACKAYLLVGCSIVLFSAVSVVNVYANMPSFTAPTALGNYLMNAFAHTELVVQIMFVGLIVATAMLVRDVLRGVGKHTLSFVAHA
jgi:hypothetical protein